jgi:hypothetical protein
VSIDAALNLLAQMSQGVTVSTNASGVYSAGGKNYIMNKKEFDKANNAALDVVAEEAVNMVKKWLSVPYTGNGSSRPGESPRRRDGNLMDSIHFRKGRASRQFPSPTPPSASARANPKTTQAYQWYQNIQNNAYSNNSIINPYPSKDKFLSATRVIEVNPRFADKSDRQRLEYYSYYLETGWFSRPNKQFNDKGTTSKQRGIVKRKRGKKSLSLGTKYNPPRPYLRKLTYNVNKAYLLGVYKSALRVRLPNGMKHLADQAVLTITYQRGLRVPFASQNRNIL